LTLNRISTGVPGLDSLIEGGIPSGFTAMIAGNSGTGKTILSSHFVYDGLTSKDEDGISFLLMNLKHNFMPTTKGLEWTLKNSKDKRSLHIWTLLH
jgi:circadian clock protein KaiC